MSTIHAAQVTSWGAAPTYTTIPAPAAPSSSSDTVQIRVLATGVHQLVRSRAAGKHYTSGGLPHIVGVDGVGTTVADGEGDGQCEGGGKTVYFITIRAGDGSFAELLNVPRAYVFDLPARATEKLAPEAIAAIMNPATSSWMALKTRVDLDRLPKAWSVLIVGATSASGAIAATLARKLGATRVIGLARNASKLATIPGLDSALTFADPVTSTDFSQLGEEVDVILDYLYGPPTAHLLSTLPRQRRPLQYVQIGTVAGPEIALPGAVLRSKNLTIRGAGPGAWGFDELREHLPAMLGYLEDVQWRPALRVEKLNDIEKVWFETEKDGERLVFTL